MEEPRSPPAPQPIRLPAEYLRAVERVERQPGNQDGADKSWMQRAFEDAQRHWRRARRARP